MQFPPHVRPVLAVGVALALGPNPIAAIAGEILPGRDHNAVHVEGAVLKALQGLQVGELALLAYGGERFEAIPFQVDERDSDGEWVLTHGIEAEADVDGGALDANDLLVFMAADAGDKAPRAPPGRRPGLELRIHDPLTGASGWVYLVHAPVDPPRSDRRYVELEASTDSIESELYGLTFSRKLPISWAYLTFNLGDPHLNIVDRLKIRARAVILYGLLDWTLDEEDMHSVPTGYLGGPVRAIRRIQNQIDFGMGIESPLYFLDMIYYRDSIYLPARVYIPIDLSTLVVESEVLAYIDFRDLTGWEVQLPGGGRVQLNGRPGPDEAAVSDEPGSSFVVVGSELSLYVRMILGDSLPEVVPYVYLVDDEDQADPPEDDPGQRPSIGLRLTRYETVAKGTHEVDVEIHALRDYEPGDEAEALRKLERPLETTAGPLPR